MTQTTKITLFFKGTKRHNDATIACCLSLSLLISATIRLNRSDKHKRICNAMIVGAKAL
jgi:hypothetical protein